MGYTTEFYGKIKIVPALSSELVEYINNFKETRRMKRDNKVLQNKYAGEYGFNNQYGVDGEYFIGGEGFMGQDFDPSVIDGNEPPVTQPSLWCQWEVTEDGNFIEWDGAEKFYESKAWMNYIIRNFIAPFGHVCNGEIKAQGEEINDRWMLIVKDNKATSKNLR